MLYVGFTYFSNNMLISILIGLVLAVDLVISAFKAIVWPTKQEDDSTKGALAVHSILLIFLFLLGLSYLIFTFGIYIPLISVSTGLMLGYVYIILNFIGLVAVAYERQKERKKQSLR
jgi:CHASE2 domain-containing sensor protein